MNEAANTFSWFTSVRPLAQLLMMSIGGFLGTDTIDEKDWNLDWQILTRWLIEVN